MTVVNPSAIVMAVQHLGYALGAMSLDELIAEYRARLASTQSLLSSDPGRRQRNIELARTIDLLVAARLLAQRAAAEPAPELTTELPIIDDRPTAMLRTIDEWRVSNAGAGSLGELLAAMHPRDAITCGAKAPSERPGHTHQCIRPPGHRDDRHECYVCHVNFLES